MTVAGARIAHMIRAAEIFIRRANPFNLFSIFARYDVVGWKVIRFR